MKIVNQTPTLDTSAYTAGDAVGTLLTFDIGIGFKTAVLKSLEILDDNASPDSADLDIHFFTDSSLVGVDNSAYAVTQANFTNGEYIGKVSVVAADYVATAIGTNAAAVLARKDNVDLFVPLANGVVYAQLVAVGAPTFAATQLHVRAHFAEYA